MTQGSLFNNETKSQESAILEYLRQGNALTPIDALSLFKCFRLGARIFGLKKQGWNIEREMVKVPSGKNVASYRLKA